MSTGADAGIFRSGMKDLKMSELSWRILILGSIAAVFLISVYCLAHGITTIFMHLYYFPIILLAYHYRYRGFVFASILSAAYLGLVYYFDVGQADVVTGAWYRFFVFIGIAAIIAYLSERLVADKDDLQESTRKYQNLFENMLEGFAYCRMFYDANGRPVDWIYLNVNPAFERLTGLKNIIGKRVLDAIPDIKELTPELFETYGRVASSGKPETFEIDFKPLNMWLKVSVFSPEKEYFIAVFEDITTRKKAEAELQKSEKRYRDLFELNNAVMLILDPKTGMIIDANEAASRYYGYSREELRELLITRINTADPARIQKDMADAAGSQGAVFQFRHRKKDGEIRDVQIFSAPVMLGDHPLLHSIIQDITDQKIAEDALKQTNKKLNLLSSITRHDIINQLFSLKAYLHLSKDTLDNPPQLSEYLIKEERAVSAIERQIAFTKEYEDLGVREPVWQNVGICVKNAMAALPMRDLHIENACGTLEIFADPLFEKVFYNLIDNALRYGGTKMTTISLSSREQDTGLIMNVEDDGQGISARDKTQLFERGFGHHTGLGLFLSREILAITGITITETGEPGKGARFEIVVPKGSWRFSAGLS